MRRVLRLVVAAAVVAALVPFTSRADTSCSTSGCHEETPLGQCAAQLVAPANQGDVHAGQQCTYVASGAGHVSFASTPDPNVACCQSFGFAVLVNDQQTAAARVGDVNGLAGVWQFAAHAGDRVTLGLFYNSQCPPAPNTCANSGAVMLAEAGDGAS